MLEVIYSFCLESSFCMYLLSVLLDNSVITASLFLGLIVIVFLLLRGSLASSLVFFLLLLCFSFSLFGVFYSFESLFLDKSYFMLSNLFLINKVVNTELVISLIRLICVYLVFLAFLNVSLIADYSEKKGVFSFVHISFLFLFLGISLSNNLLFFFISVSFISFISLYFMISVCKKCFTNFSIIYIFLFGDFALILILLVFGVFLGNMNADVSSEMWEVFSRHNKTFSSILFIVFFLSRLSIFLDKELVKRICSEMKEYFIFFFLLIPLYVFLIFLKLYSIFAVYFLFPFVLGFIIMFFSLLSIFTVQNLYEILVYFFFFHLGLLTITFPSSIWIMIIPVFLLELINVSCIFLLIRKFFHQNVLIDESCYEYRSGRKKHEKLLVCILFIMMPFTYFFHFVSLLFYNVELNYFIFSIIFFVFLAVISMLVYVFFLIKEYYLVGGAGSSSPILLICGGVLGFIFSLNCLRLLSSLLFSVSFYEGFSLSAFFYEVDFWVLICLFFFIFSFYVVLSKSVDNNINYLKYICFSNHPVSNFLDFLMKGVGKVFHLIISLMKVFVSALFLFEKNLLFFSPKKIFCMGLSFMTAPICKKNMNILSIVILIISCLVSIFLFLFERIGVF